MSRNVSFSMNTGAGGGKDIIQEMAAPMIMDAAKSIASRAEKISSSIRVHPQKFDVEGPYVGLPNRRGGQRAYAKVVAAEPNGGDAYYNDYQTLRLALDAGRVVNRG